MKAVHSSKGDVTHMLVEILHRMVLQDVEDISPEDISPAYMSRQHMADCLAEEFPVGRVELLDNDGHTMAVAYCRAAPVAPS